MSLQRLNECVDWLNDCIGWEVINILNAVTNVFGLLAFNIPGLSWYDRALVGLTIMASVLMHLSERKHYLPGIKPFSLWAKWFLFLDRYTAIQMGSILIYYTWRYNLWEMIFPKSYIWVAILVGLLSVLMSETVFVHNTTFDKIGFVVFHTIWHFLAYSIIFNIMYLVTKERIINS